MTLELEQIETLLGLAERQLSLATRELARSEKLKEMKVTSQAERDRSEPAELEARRIRLVSAHCSSPKGVPGRTATWSRSMG